LSEVTNYETGVPCWVDAQTSDLPTTVDFYCALFGWDDEDQGEEAGHYTMFRRKGLEVAAIFPLMAEGTQPRWTTYLATDDLDDTAAKVQAAGGVVFQGPIDIFDSGRMAIVADPTGTVFGVWEAGEHIGARLVNEPGAIAWNELNVRDVDAALAFYTSVFGLTVHEINLGTDEAPLPYRELQVDGRTVAGVTQMTDDWPADIPSHWTVVFSVADADTAAALAVEMGGLVHVPPTDIAPGRYSVLTDPVGAAFSILQLR
jgi:predicted enzyme related to lactoylglutathione lyase